MDARSESTKNPTKVDRRSDRELVVTRTFDAPARIVWQAWTMAELFSRWWIPKSSGLTLLSCEMDVRVGGAYRLAFAMGDQSVAVFGKYLEVTPPSRLVWTNEEAGDAVPVTTLTLEERDGKTFMVKLDTFPTKEALDAEIASGATSGLDETFTQLDEFLTTERARL